MAQSPLLRSLRSASFQAYERSHLQGMSISRALMPGGRYVAALGAATLLMSMDFSQEAMPYIASFCGSLLLVGYLSNRFRRLPSIRIERTLPRRAIEGEPFEYSIALSNPGSSATPHMDVRDHAKMRMPSPSLFSRLRAPFESDLNAFDRWSGYSKWLWLLERGQDAIASDFPAAPLAPGETRSLSAKAVSFRRGERLFLGFYCGIPDPFGMTRRVLFFPKRQTVTVLPKPKPFPLRIPTGSRSRQPGDRALEHSADSEEFRSLREWRSGDSFRRIDWRATARAGEPIIREYSPEYSLRSAIAIDTFAPDPDWHRSDEMARRAAGLLLGMDRKETIVDLAFIDGQAHRIETLQAHADPLSALDLLAAIPDEPSEDRIAQLRSSLLERAPSLSSVALLFAVWDPARSELARELAAMGLGVCVLVFSPPADLAFPAGVRGMFFEEALWGP